MIFKKYSFQIYVLAILMAINMYMFFWSIEVKHLQFSVYAFAFFALVFLLLIIRLSIKNNIRIHRFLENYVVNEGSPVFNSGFAGNSFEKIEEQLNRISKLYGEVKIEKESDHVFLQQLIDEIKVGVLVFSNKGDIKLRNSFFTKLFGIHSMQSIELLQNEFKDIYRFLANARAGLRVFRVMNNGQRVLLSVSVHQFKQNKEDLSLALFHDITNEVSQEEVESWQKLLKILRHEIINSLTPIATLSSTLIDNLDEVDYKKTFEGEHSKLIETNYKGLKAIEKRSEGLMDFIKAYKELSSTLKPDLREVETKAFFDNLKNLVQADLKQKNIALNIDLDLQVSHLFIDEKQIMQVMLNLIKNAAEALENSSQAQISIRAHKEENKTALEVEDNGPGIPEGIIDSVFIPFFSTKKEGSGIGLSLCKQIMHLHKADIKVFSKAGETLFRLGF